MVFCSFCDVTDGISFYGYFLSSIHVIIILLDQMRKVVQNI
jgi:hypothetical protein